MRGNASSGISAVARSWHRGDGRGPDIAETAVDVGDGVLVAARARLEGRHAAELRLAAAGRGRAEGEVLPVLGYFGLRVALFEQDVAPARLQAQEGAVAVEVLALAGEVGQRV